MPSLETRTPFTGGIQKLTSPALRALAGVLPALYRETDPHALPRAFGDALAQLVPGEAHEIVVHDRASGHRFWHLRPAAAGHAALLPGFFASFHEFAPATYRRSTGTGAALALSDFTNAAALRRLAIYHDYYRPLGLEDDLSINVERGEVVTCAAVLRRRRGFRTEERELMNALRPHFKQAWANAQNLAELRARSQSTPAPTRTWTPEPLEVRYGLTPREAEVLIWVAQGKTNPEVGQILGIRPYTVRTHLERVFLKLRVETRHAAGLCAIEVLGFPR